MSSDSETKQYINPAKTLRSEDQLFIYNDRKRLEVILKILLENAQKFNRNDGFIQISIEHEEKDENILCITIINALYPGNKISEDIKSRKFKTV